jgi:CheY-like chemotaxis protein
VSVVTVTSPQSVHEDTQCRVLVVDDDASCQDIVLLMLDRLGYHADAASDGVEAISALHAAFYDIVLMDVRMRYMDGMEATRLIRANLDTTKQPTIIAMTADTTLRCREECFRAGMDQHLGKPVRIDALATLLESRLHHHGDLQTLSGYVADDKMEGTGCGTVVYDSEILDALLVDLGGDGVMRIDLIESFILDAEVRSGAIVAAGETADFNELVFQAHAIKSASATIGLLALAELARELEELEVTSDVDVTSQASRLVAECWKATEALHAELIDVGFQILRRPSVESTAKETPHQRN